MPPDQEAGRQRGIAGVLYGGSAAFLVIQVAGAGLSFGLHLLFVRIGGPEQYGHLAYALNWLAFLLLPAHLGLNTASLRFVSAYRALGDWGRLSGFLRATARAVAGSALIITAATASWVWARGSGMEPDLAAALVVLAAGLPATALLTLWGAQLRALGKIAASQLPLSVLFPTVAGLLAAITLRAPEASAWRMALVYSGAMCAAAVVSGRLLARARPDASRRVGATYEMTEWRSVAAPMLAIAVLQIVQLRTTTAILGLVAPATDVARYAVSLRLAALLSFGFAAVSAWASPLISRYHSLGDRDALVQLARLGARATLGLALAVGLVLAIGGKELLGLFDPGFAGAYPVLLLLATAELLTCFTGTAASLLIMTGLQSTATRIEAAVAALTVALSALLIPRHGLVGAAVVMLLVSLFRNSALALLVWRKLGIRCGPL